MGVDIPYAYVIGTGAWEGRGSGRGWQCEPCQAGPPQPELPHGGRPCPQSARGSSPCASLPQLVRPPPTYFLQPWRWASEPTRARAARVLTSAACRCARCTPRLRCPARRLRPWPDRLPCLSTPHPHMPCTHPRRYEYLTVAKELNKPLQVRAGAAGCPRRRSPPGLAQTATAWATGRQASLFACRPHPARARPCTGRGGTPPGHLLPAVYGSGDGRGLGLVLLPATAAAAPEAPRLERSVALSCRQAPLQRPECRCTGAGSPRRSRGAPARLPAPPSWAPVPARPSRPHVEALPPPPPPPLPLPLPPPPPLPQDD